MTLYTIKTYNLSGKLLENKTQYTDDFMSIVRTYKKSLLPGMITLIIDWHTKNVVCRVYKNGYEMTESR